jgi:acyl-coenzyme A synthetase/AMP-(fatty) acid ligase
VKGLRIGRRRGRDSDAAVSPLELALRPALVDGRWQIPDRFNFTRDVVEALARDPKRRALTSLGKEGVIEHRNFLEISDGAAVWATTLREAGISSGDRVLIVAGTTVDWLEIVLGTLKTGAVVVPCMPTVTASMLERIVSSTDAALVVGARSLEPTIAQMGFTPDVHLYEEGAKRNSKDVPDAATHDTASRDLAFIVSTPGVGGARKDVAHTHGSIFATRVQAEHWLDVGRGDAVWCTTDAASALTMWNTVAGPWSRGAEVVLHEGAFEVDERLDLLFRLGPSILCQSPGEYAALAAHPKLERFRSPRLRRLVSTGDFLDPEVVAVFEERWGMTIYDGYGQAETNVVIANLADGAAEPGAIGRALPGHHVAVIDDQGNELPAGIEGDLAVRGRPPTLFAGYWELPDETKSAFLGDWYLTGDVAQVDEDGVFTFVGRAEDVITSSGRTFGPFDVERVLAGHAAIAAAAVVGIRDLQRGGHFVRAFVVPRAGADGSEQL